MDAAIYCRISHDVTGEAIGVRRQERECRALAQRRDLTVVEVLVDNDISAYSGVPRPAYQQLLGLIRADAIHAVLAWHPDRLHRSLKELEEFIAAVDKHSVEVFTCTAGDVDLSTPIGRMIARQLGTFARYESEHRSERSVAGKRDAAKRGRWPAGPPYGYDLERDAAGHPVGNGRLVIVPGQAKVIHEAARRVLAGEAVYSICKDLQQRGVPSPKGGAWRPPSLSAILVSPTAAGLRDYKGEFTAKGLWNPILSMEDHLALRQRLADNRRTKGLRPARKNLLVNGLLRCGLCGYHLTSMVSSQSYRPKYVCLKTVASDGCNGIAIAGNPLEAHIVSALFDRIGHESMAKLIANHKAFGREVQRRTTIETRLLLIAELFADGHITRAEWIATRHSLSEQLRQIPNHPAHLGGLTLGEPADMHREWARLPMDRRRELLHLVIDKVVVGRATSRGPAFDPCRIVIHWR